MPAPAHIPPSPLASALDELVLALGRIDIARTAQEDPAKVHDRAPYLDALDGLERAGRKVMASTELAPLVATMAETNGTVPLASTADHLHVSWLPLAATPGTAGVAFRFGSTLGQVNGSPPVPVASPVLIGSAVDLRRVGTIVRDVFNAAARGA